MARLAVLRRTEVDSDDEEFPDVREVLRGGVRGGDNSMGGEGKSSGPPTKLKIGVQRTIKAVVDRNPRAGPGRHNVKLRTGEIDREGNGSGDSSRVIDPPKSIRKKRVLKTVADNPLLRPIETDIPGTTLGERLGSVCEGRKARKPGMRGRLISKKVEEDFKKEEDVRERMESISKGELHQRDSIPGAELVSTVMEKLAITEPSLAKPLKDSKRTARVGRTKTLGGAEPEHHCVADKEHIKEAVKEKPTSKGLNPSRGISLDITQVTSSNPTAKQPQETVLDEAAEATATDQFRNKQSRNKSLKSSRNQVAKDTEEAVSPQLSPSEISSRSKRKLSRKSTPTPPSESDSEALPEDSESEFESAGLSGFIVNDSSYSEAEESVVIEKLAPRSGRRLVRGRRHVAEDSESESELELKMGRLKMLDDFASDAEVKPSGGSTVTFPDRSKVETSPRGKLTSKILTEPQTAGTEVGPSIENLLDGASDMEDPFTLRYSPSPYKPMKVSFTTPPGSPSLRPKGLRSPQKLPRIPSTPHRPSMDAFWQQDVINAWHDEYSPKKTPRPTTKIDLLEDADSSSENTFSSTKLSPQKQSAAEKAALKAFSKQKESLAQSFLLELDNTITNGQVSHLASSTGGIKIIWSKKLNTTAGRAHWKCVRPNPSCLSLTTDPPPTPTHHASIELASKIISSPSRLYNTLAHEFCHLATFMISNQTKNPHGKEFKAWGAKCATHFGHHGVVVTTKHSYEIAYRFVWECGNCGVMYQRHSRSIDPSRHRCGKCRAGLVQVKPTPKKGKMGTEGELGKEGGGKGKLGEYQAFVRDNLGRVREELGPGSPHKVVMGEVGRRYRTLKAGKIGDAGIGGVVGGGSREGSIELVNGSRENSVESVTVAPVVRKLDFLDLTSP